MRARTTSEHAVWQIPAPFVAGLAAGLGTTAEHVRRDLAIAIDTGLLTVCIQGDQVDLVGSFPNDVCP